MKKMPTGYIVYTEPSHKHSGCKVDFFVRELASDGERFGRSRLFSVDLPWIIPTFEMKNDKAESLLEKCIRDFPESRFPRITFKRQFYSTSKSVIWAYIWDKAWVYGKQRWC